MNEPKTPNLGLNKIDRSSPSTTYFDLDKYLDQNWEKVDDFAEQVEEKIEETAAQVSSIQERLDIEQRKSVTLEPGLQIINAERASGVKLEGLKGRTLVNLLGRDGGCEAVSAWFTTTGVAAALDSSDKTQGTNSIKVTINTGNTGGSLYYLLGTSLSNSKNYLAIADLKKGTSTSVSLSLWNGTVNVSGTVVTASKFNPSVLLIPASSVGSATNNLQISVDGTEAGQYSHVDAVRLYEITAVELTSLSSMTAEQVAAKYPYVDSVQPVRNPYVIRYGENLLPPLYEATYRTTSSKIIAPYIYQQTAASPDPWTRFTITVIPQTDYYLSFSTLDGKGMLAVLSVDEKMLLLDYGQGGRTFNSGIHTQISVYINGTEDRVDTIINPMLTLGKTAKLFKSQEDVMLALQTDLYADPVTGANADEVFQKDGQYFKFAKWKRVVLDGSMSWYVPGKVSGFTIVSATGFNAAIMYNNLVVHKYDGKILTSFGDMKNPDNCYFPIANLSEFQVSVSNADSGWGDSYTPSADEIKAYFMGWTMFNGSVSGNSPDSPPNNVYNGTGTKWWVRRSDGLSAKWADATSVLPTTQAPNWTPYQLVYQIATPTVEPIMSEGQLTLIEGSNQVEVGTGIMLRESVKPVYATNYYRFNDTTLSGTNLSFKLSKVVSMYRESMEDHGWEFISDQYAHGTYKARISPDKFDPSATYSVTYLSMHTSPAVSFVGSIAGNDKALLTATIDSLHDTNSRLDFLENFFGKIISDGVVNGAIKETVKFNEDIVKGSMVSIIEGLKEVHSTLTNGANTGLPDMVNHPNINRLALYDRGNKNSVRVLNVNSDGYFSQIYSTGIGTEPVRTVSLYGDYMAVGFTQTPYIFMRKWNGTAYGSLAIPNITPAGSVFNTAFSPDGKFLIVGYNASPYWDIYKRTEDSFVKLPPVTGMPASVGTKEPKFTPDGKYLFVPNNTTSGVLIFKISGDTFTKLSNSISPGFSGQGDIIFTNDSKYVVFSYLNRYGPFVYQINPNDTFTNVNITYEKGTSSWEGTLPVRNADKSPDGTTIFFALTDGTVRRMNISGKSFVVATPEIPTPGQIYDVRFSADNKFLLVTVNIGTNVYIKSYEWDVFTKEANMLRSITDITSSFTGIGYALEDGKLNEAKKIMKLI